MATSSVSLARKIQGLRQARALTQQQLAVKAEVSLSTVSKLEEGAVTKPAAKTLLKLVKVLDFDLDQLLSPEPLPAHLLPRPKTSAAAAGGIQFVYSDIGGVLLHTESALLQHLSIVYKRPIERIRALYYQYVPIANRGDLSLQDLQILYLLKLNIRFHHRQKGMLFKHWVDYYQPILPMQQFLAEVAKRHPVGLLTDTIDGFVERMQKRQLLPALKYRSVIKSCKEGVTKPDKRIYNIAAQKAGVPPGQILFIDDKKINVEGAKEAGWQAEWFDELHPEESVNRIRAKYF